MNAHTCFVLQCRASSRSSVGVLRSASEPCEEKGSAAQGGGGGWGSHDGHALDRDDHLVPHLGEGGVARQVDLLEARRRPREPVRVRLPLHLPNTPTAKSNKGPVAQQKTRSGLALNCTGRRPRPVTNLSTEDRCSCENDSITSHHRAFEWFGPGFSKLRKATRGVKLRKAGKACGEKGCGPCLAFPLFDGYLRLAADREAELVHRPQRDDLRRDAGGEHPCADRLALLVDLPKPHLRQPFDELQPVRKRHRNRGAALWQKGGNERRKRAGEQPSA